MLAGVRQIGVFAGALIRQVAALVTGSVAAALAIGYEHWSGQTISWRAFAAGLAMFLVVACFRAWRQQQQLVDMLSTRIAELQGSDVIESYAEISVVRSGDSTFDIDLAFRRNVAAVLPATEFPGAFRVIWSEPFMSPDYLVTVSSKPYRAAHEELSKRNTESILIFLGVAETTVTVHAKGRRAVYAGGGHARRGTVP